MVAVGARAGTRAGAAANGNDCASGGACLAVGIGVSIGVGVGVGAVAVTVVVFVIDLCTAGMVWLVTVIGLIAVYWLRLLMTTLRLTLFISAGCECVCIRVLSLKFVKLADVIGVILSIRFTIAPFVLTATTVVVGGICVAATVEIVCRVPKLMC